MKPGRPGDGARVREQIRGAGATFGGDEAFSPERRREILEERARLLARAPAPDQDPSSVEAVTFILSDERYALELRYIREIVRFSAFTPVPYTPEFVVGVTHYRGEILSAIDLRKFFGMEVRGVTDLSRTIVVGGKSAAFGLLADETRALETLTRGELLDPPDTVRGIGREYLRGVTRDALLVLDGEALLDDPRLFIEYRAKGEDFGGT